MVLLLCFYCISIVFLCSHFNKVFENSFAYFSRLLGVELGRKKVVFLYTSTKRLSVMSSGRSVRPPKVLHKNYERNRQIHLPHPNRQAWIKYTIT